MQKKNNKQNTQNKIKIQNGLPMPFVSYIRKADTREAALKRVIATRNPWTIGSPKLKKRERGWKF